MDFGMPLDEAMRTRRAIRRLKPDPVTTPAATRVSPSGNAFSDTTVNSAAPARLHGDRDEKSGNR